MKLSDFMFWATILGLGCVMVYGMISGLQNGMASEEVTECRKWQEQAAEYAPSFYIVQWQADQCKAHDITINAPVK